MTIPVPVDKLGQALADFGSGYLCTVSAQGRVKVLIVQVVSQGETLIVSGPSPGSAANLAENRAVTLVFPPTVAGGHTLLVDGTGRPVGDDFEITPESAILHRRQSPA